jgi:hypothetical protein
MHLNVAKRLSPVPSQTYFISRFFQTELESLLHKLFIVCDQYMSSLGCHPEMSFMSSFGSRGMHSAAKPSQNIVLPILTPLRCRHYWIAFHYRSAAA